MKDANLPQSLDGFEDLNVQGAGDDNGGEPMDLDLPGPGNGGVGEMNDPGDDGVYGQVNTAGAGNEGANGGDHQGQQAGGAAPQGPWVEIRVPRGVTVEEEEEEEDWAVPGGEDLAFLPPAYEREESPAIRMAYLQAVLNDTKHHLPVRKTESNLRSTLKIIDAAQPGGLPLFPPPARTLETARRRLGVDDDQWIIQYGACPVCWKLYHPTTLETLESPTCSVDGCDGVIYSEVEDAKGNKSKRTSMIIPQVSLVDSVRRMVCRKGYRAKLRDNRDKPVGQNDDPNFVMKDIYDGSMWNDLHTEIKREKEDKPLGNVRDVGIDGGDGGNLNDNRFALHATVNLDWFGCVKNRPHSTGPIYLSFNDLPREERFLQYNVVCIAITPGPTEPTTEQLNHVLEPIMSDVALLKNGVTMKMYNDDETAFVNEKVYLDVICNNCDTPGARKIAGFAGHSALVHPCPWCKCTLLDVNKAAGYDFENFALREDSEVLKQKFFARESSDARKATILERHGVQWSALDYLPGWRPTAQTALDFMHCIFLGVVRFLFMHILFAAHLFTGAGGENSTKKRFERAVNSICWPSHITRLPKNLGDNQSLAKADEWRRLLTVAPIILWMSWKEDDDEIPDTEPPVLPNEVITTEHSRKRKSLYGAILYLCAAVRLLSNKTITMTQAVMGQMYLKMYCLQMIALGVVLTINHHLAMHFSHMIKLPKQLALAPLNLYNYPLLRNTTDEDAAPVEVYELVLEYARTTWPNQQFQRQFDNIEDAVSLIGNQVARRLAYVRKDGIRYAPKTNKRSKAGTDSYAFIQQGLNTRIPVVIEDAFLLKISELPGHVCLLVRRLQSTPTIDQFIFPWNGYASTLGIHVAEANRLGPYELIAASQLTAPLALIPTELTSLNIQLHIAVSFDHLTVEPETPFDDGGEGVGEE